MRFHSVAICTLMVLLAGGLSAQASNNPISEGSTQEPIAQDDSVVTPTVTASKIEPIALSDKLEEQNLSQPVAINSKEESPLEHSLSTQNSQVVADRQVQVVAEAPKVEALNPDKAANESLNPNADLSASLIQSPLATVSTAEALRSDDVIAQSSTNNTSQLVADEPEAGATCIAQAVVPPALGDGSTTSQLAQRSQRQCPRPQPIPQIVVPEPYEEYGASPALSIYIPVGYGADNNTVFLSGSYQESVREDEGSVGAGGIGIGIGDATEAVGLELSYALKTAEEGEFGEGGFNAKLHRRFGQDASFALGWNGFVNIGRNDFEHSKYGVLTKVFRTQESLDQFFSRVAVTVGVGDGQFRSNGAVDAGDNNINVFGNVAVRVVRPVSFIAEWTGQDLALGLSIAPFKNIPFVITPAVRDLAGAGDEARFVLGAGTAFRF
jgi:hypothetical protein